jgi:hypothetical protein
VTLSHSASRILGVVRFTPAATFHCHRSQPNCGGYRTFLPRQREQFVRHRTAWWIVDPIGGFLSAGKCRRRSGEESSGYGIHARSVKGVIEVGLLRECEHAELLVVERHRDAHRASIGRGTLTRHLIEHTPCPVMITPQSHASDYSDDADATEPKATNPS